MILIKPKLRSDSDSPNKLFDGADALFQDEVKKVDVDGEYGCGKWTKWVLNNTSTDVIAVDTSSEWVSAVKKDNESNCDRLHIHRSNLGDVGGFGRPFSYEKIDSFSDYTDFYGSKKRLQNLCW